MMPSKLKKTSELIRNLFAQPLVSNSKNTT